MVLIFYFFRRRFALAIARLCQGASSEVADAPPPLDIRVNADIAAASAFSLDMRWYSAGGHLFCAISNARRITVSHDASIRLVIIAGRDDFFLVLGALMMDAFSDRDWVERPQIWRGSD